MSDINEFLEILERRESWTVDQDKALLKRCLIIADKITNHPHEASQISFDNWLVFMASLPYKLSIICLSRLDEAFENVISELVSPQRTSILIESRMIMLHRCNIIVRKELQTNLFSGKEAAIRKIARAINLEGAP